MDTKTTHQSSDFPRNHPQSSTVVLQEKHKTYFPGNTFDRKDVECRTPKSLNVEETPHFDFPGNTVCKNIAKPSARSWGKTLLDLEREILMLPRPPAWMGVV